MAASRSAAIAGFVGVGRRDPGALGKSQRERADAGKQVRDRAGVAHMGRDQARQRLLARRRGLQEGAGRQRHHGASHPYRRRRPTGDELAVPGEPRQSATFGEPRQRDRLRRGERARATQVDVETGIGRGHLDVERLSGRAERLGDRPGGFERAAEPGRQDRAVVDRDDVVLLNAANPT